METPFLARYGLRLDQILRKYLPDQHLNEVKRIIYGRSDDHAVRLCDETLFLGRVHNFEVKAYRFNATNAKNEQPRMVRVACVQNSINTLLPQSVDNILLGIHNKMENFIKAAAQSKVNILCLQETWEMPFAFVTGEIFPWNLFAEDVKTGITAQFIMKMAKLYNMVIISPILERDEQMGDLIWNTAVVFSNTGNYLGKYRKNHIPVTNECRYYLAGNLGHPVFETAFGKIGIAICFDRHHPLNWMMLAVNGAEIVFNPSATQMNISSCWLLQARNAAISNGYYTVAINRTGCEYFERKFTTGGGRDPRNMYGPYHGSSYVAAPNGCVTPSMPTNRDGLLIADLDLNLCGEMRERLSIPKSFELPVYAERLRKYCGLEYAPESIRDAFFCCCRQSSSDMSSVEE